jgi:FkbM family methyltransferase
MLNNLNKFMFNYQSREYKKINFNASDLIQYDLEINLPVFLGKPAVKIKNIIVVGAWQGDEIRSFLKFPEANIYCFEANPKTFDILKKLYKDETRVHCFNYACSDNDGKATFYETNIDGNGSLLKVGNHPAAKSSGSFEVDTIRLDSLVEFKNVDIDLLWIDVQGAELAVLRGADGLLKRTAALFLEINTQGNSYQGAVKASDLELFISNYGFSKIAQGLDNTGLEGNAFYKKSGQELFDESIVEKRLGGIMALKANKREIYNNVIFKFIHRLTPQKIRTLLKKIIHFD